MFFITCAAGFIPRALSKKLKQSNHQLNQKTDDHGITYQCQDWVNKLDRGGGLNHENSNMYTFIAAMELQLQSLLQQRNNQPTTITMDKATSILMSNNDILFHWSLICWQN